MLPLALALTLAVACTKAANDAQVTSDIQSKLASDSGLQNKQIGVQSDKGSVTLSGTVENDAQREAAARYAASAPGVKQVINNLQVAPMSAMAAPQDAPQSAPASAPMDAAPAPSYSKPTPSANPERLSPREKKHHHRSSYESDSSAPAPAMAASAPEGAASPAAAPAPVAQNVPPPPPPPPAKVTVPSGTSLPVRLIETIDSATAQTGDTFHATLDSPIAIDGEVVVPAHYEVEGHIVAAQASGKFAGRALLELQLDRIKVGDRWYNVETDHFKQETGARGKNTAEKVGVGAVAGAVLGGIFGGGKGAAIGSVAGAGAGGGVQAASKKPDIKLSSERILTFALQQPVTLVPTTKPARSGQKMEVNDQPQTPQQ
jgi:hypothetical protein